ncbi:hypothetical protein [Alicyclobacillus acidocaldarius]|uniref:Uncharacterized protein n=1 Tax=Alicyclobacillus acidocaldarius subsp. acidocaldarius (strain ATCC 27009 / DSM 446 / BCRC 14685 / JCM 5260 / KCTC 1825 / NBRC 15652 / NCIMB 11725 / NRRL B-14509 / 104-IA) TaxID=521098 RepID=C8WSW8_ALIAD|nr:hypothetical protein [Alicyclobacillus acidocaldarius]ACV57624.1 hypothetical protein Aaci_0576 [Alicyclobacillus acidocaldarius subsp. acidocaldarius DSM 446]
MLLPDISSIAPYPPANYAFDANGTLGRFDPIYIFANLLWTFCTFLVQVSLAFFQWGIQGTALSGLLDAVLSVIHLGVNTLEPIAFVLALFVLAGMWVWDLLRKRPTVMWARFVKMCATLFAIWIYGHVNATFVNTLNNATDETAASLGNVVLSLTHQGETVSSASTTLEQQIWSSLVQVPWEQGEMGGDLSIRSDDLSSVEACATSGVDWNKVQTTDKWADALLQLPVGNQARNCMAGILNSSKYPTAQQAFSSGNRLSVTLAVGFNLLGPVLFLLVFGLLAMIARAGFLITLMLGVFVLPVELFPVTRTYGRTLRWALTALAGLVGTAVIDLYVAVVIVVGDVFQNAIQGAPLFLSMLWLNVLYFAAIFVFFWLLRRANLRKRIRETVKKVEQRLPDRVPVGLGESIQITKPAMTKALRRSRTSAAQRMRSVSSSDPRGGDGGQGGGASGNFGPPGSGPSSGTASGGAASSYNGPPSGNFGASDASGRDSSDPAAAASLIRLSDLDTNRRTRKVPAVGPSAEGGNHGKDPNPPKSDPFDSRKGRLPKRALMTDQTRRVPLPQSLKAKAAEAAAVLGTAALAKGAAKVLPKVRKATGAVLRKNMRRVPVPESLRTPVLERTADLRRRWAERRGQASLRIRRGTGVTWHEDARRVPVPDKLRVKAENVKAKLAESAASVPINARRVPAMGVIGTLSRRRVPLPEQLRVLREQARSRGLSRLTDPANAEASPSVEGPAHREQPRANARANASANAMEAGKQAQVSTRPKPTPSVGTQRVRRALGVAGQTALQTFAMGAGMSEKAEQTIRSAVSKTARALQASTKRVRSEMDKTSAPTKQSAQPGAERMPKSSSNTKVQPVHADELRRESQGKSNTTLSVTAPQPTNRSTPSVATAISRPTVKPTVKSESATFKAVGDKRATNEPQPSASSQEKVTTQDPSKSQTTVSSGIKITKRSAPSGAVQRPSVRRERPRIRSQESTNETPATTPPSTAQPIVKRTLTTKRTPPKS